MAKSSVRVRTTYRGCEVLIEKKGWWIFSYYLFKIVPPWQLAQEGLEPYMDFEPYKTYNQAWEAAIEKVEILRTRSLDGDAELIRPDTQENVEEREQFDVTS